MNRLGRTMLLLLVAACAVPGCVIVQPIVSNPMPNVTRVAVAPFVNHSPEPAVDTLLVTQAYYAELQKVPGFEVVPTAVTATAIQRHGLRITGPESALELARILDVDAVVLGAITDYDPYEPPRIGWHVEWYALRPPIFAPGVAVDPYRRPGFWTRVGIAARDARDWCLGRDGDDDAFVACEPDVIRGQSAVGPLGENAPLPIEDFLRGPAESADASERIATVSGSETVASELVPIRVLPAPRDGAAAMLIPPPPSAPGLASGPLGGAEPFAAGVPVSFGGLQPVVVPFDPHEPILAYTRLFDAKDADLLARLRDHVELNGDDRSGGWRAYLHRSEDFVRFTAHVMIAEMLTLHGGETRRRYVWKVRERT